MFLKKIELILHKIKLHKKIYQIIFETLFAFYDSGHFIKTQDSFIFSITHPDDKSIYLMVANFPGEDGFTQTQIIDDRLPVSADLKIILNFEQLIFEINRFLKTKLDFNFNFSIDSEDSEDCAEKIETNIDNNFIDKSYFEPSNLSQKNPKNLIDRFFCLETVV
jgi:hypothetical protein